MPVDVIHISCYILRYVYIDVMHIYIILKSVLDVKYISYYIKIYDYMQMSTIFHIILWYMPIYRCHEYFIPY